MMKLLTFLSAVNLLPLYICRVTPPAFNIEAEVVVKSDGAKTMAWIVIIFCDILLFTYRMVAASNTAYRYDCMADICIAES